MKVFDKSRALLFTGRSLPIGVPEAVNASAAASASAAAAAASAAEAAAIIEGLAEGGDYQVEISGAGIITYYDLPFAPASVVNVDVVINGLTQMAGAFSRAGRRVTFAEPVNTDRLPVRIACRLNLDTGALATDGDGNLVPPAPNVGLGTAENPFGEIVAERVTARVSEYAPRMQKRLGNVAVAGLFSGSDRATQGIAVLEIGGQVHAFVTQVVAGSTYLPDERIRIVECILTRDGSDMVPVAFSAPLSVGHGQDIGAEIVDGDVVLWTTMATPAAATEASAGKGFSRVVWRGADTAQADVTEYQVCGFPGSGHRRENLYQGSVSISSDGQHLILVPEDDDIDRDHKVLIFDKAEIMAAADPLAVDPVFSWSFAPPPHEFGRVVQGVHADERHVYILTGYYNPFGWTEISKYAIQTGYLLDRMAFCGPQAEIGRDALLDGTHSGYRIEAEGLSMLGDDLIIGAFEVRYSGSSIVSFEGANWAYIGTGATVTPHQMQYWQRSTKAAADGAYSSGATYTAGAVDWMRKSIWSVHLPRGEAGELPISPLDFATETTVPTAYDDAVGQAVKIGTGWRLAAYSEAVGKYYNLLTAFDNYIRLYDHRPGADNDEYALIERNSISGETYLRGKASASQSAGINLNDVDHASQPGWMRIMLPAVGADPARIINARSGSSPALWTDDATLSIGLVNYFLRALCTNNLTLKDGVTAPSTVAGAAQIYVDTADGDLKVKFGDGTVKTISTDT